MLTAIWKNIIYVVDMYNYRHKVPFLASMYKFLFCDTVTLLHKAFGRFLFYTSQDYIFSKTCQLCVQYICL